MRLSTLTIFLVGSLASALPSENEFSLTPSVELIDLSTASIPTVEQAAKQARKLLLHETIATLSTVFPSGERHGLEGQPIGLMDYYNDCSEDGTPIILGMNIATTFRNLAPSNSTLSLSIRSHIPAFSPAAHPRLSLLGKLVKIDPDSQEAEDAKKCFLRRHPDARLWVPGNKIHESFWVKMEVENVYWIGGFGNVAYIGWIPKDLFKAVRFGCKDKQGTISGEDAKIGGIGGWARWLFQDL